MAPPKKIRLTYFDMKGRGELARLILAQAKVSYEDNRVSGDSWMAFKAKTPFGQLPVLEVDGVTIAQTLTIARYLARQFGLGGKDALEQARADMIVEGVNDIMNKVAQWFREKDESAKKEKYANLSNEWLPNFLKYFEALKASNGGDWIVGSGVTYADIAIAFMLGRDGMLERSKVEWRKHAPSIAALVDRVEALPNIKTWLDKRPKTEN